MKIAVPYLDGNVNEHFGKSKQFKLYEIDEGKVVSSDIIDIEAEGHDAVAKILEDNDVMAVACGKIGEGAKEALDNLGIIVFSGACRRWHPDEP